MATRRVNPNRVKLHYSYTVQELAACLEVHKNTIRNWQRDGLEPIDQTRPLLFQGKNVRSFLTERNRARKKPCPPGTFYCLRCRQPRAPALGMVDYMPTRPDSGNLKALCDHCEGVMHRRVRMTEIATVLPNCSVQMAQAPASISGKADPSLICDLKEQS